MKIHFQVTQALRFFESCLEPFDSSALIDSKGRALLIKPTDLVDLGSFPAAASMSHQYLKMQRGDVTLLNDPFNGGSHLSSMTLILATGFSNSRSKKSASQSAFLCTRLHFRPHVSVAKHLDEEGIRIPPSPIFASGQLNEDILQALGSHPQRPENLTARLKEAVTKLRDIDLWIQSRAEDFDFQIDETFLQKYHQLNETTAKQTMSDLAMGDAKVELTLETDNTKVASHLIIDEDKVLFDFAGSTASDTLNLTDSATFGSCAGAVFSTVDSRLPITEGALRLVEVTTPKGSLVNAEYPKPMFLGLTDGPSFIASLALKMIGLVDSRRQMAQSGFSQCSVELDFGDGRCYVDQLSSGLAASPSRSGFTGMSPWKVSLRNLSIQAAESRFPILVQHHGVRKKSGGRGEFPGGHGILRVVKILEDCQLRWSWLDEIKKSSGIRGGKTGFGPECSVSLPDGTVHSIHGVGQQSLPKGTVMTLKSAGGGAVGEEPTPEEDS